MSKRFERGLKPRSTAVLDKKMNDNTKYKNTLIRMFLMENIGECIYNALFSKTSDEKKAFIYKRLSLNEVETAGHIADEIRNLGFASPMIRKAILKIVASTVFSVLSHNILENLLRRTLKKRMFRSWFNVYHDYNQAFWRLMLDHEVLQHELLNL